MRPSLTITLAALLFGLAAPVTAQAPDESPLERGRTLTRQFYDGDLTPIAALLDEQMTSLIGGEAGLRTFREQVAAQLGAEVEVLDESVTEASGNQVYRRLARFERYGGTVAVTWAFTTDGRVSGFGIRPAEGAPQAAASRFLDHETRTALRLPFDGEWTVVWGGRTVPQNYHAAYTDQRFALDLLVVRDGRTHTGTGSANEDYHCFGLPILAPGEGRVVVARDGVPDGRPGVISDADPPGNHVVIDHGTGEYSVLAHLQRGSVRVSEGDRVAPGDTLGLCGNSGRSSEPHLHYHLQTTPSFGSGEGLPAQFLDYVANDTLVRRGEPVRGQRIRPAGAAAP